MEIYNVKSILEADYGCEECSADGPKALLVLTSKESGSELRRIELSEAFLISQKINEGDSIIIRDDGTVTKVIYVSAAVILDDSGDNKRIFATARGYGEHKGLWEFPGGKIEEGETPERALIREIKEELDIEISTSDLVDVVQYDYGNFYLYMYCFISHIISGQIRLLEAESSRWLSRDELNDVKWLPADCGLISKLGLFL